MWCTEDYCKDAIRERVVNEHILLNGPATGQVAYYWEDGDEGDKGAATVATRCKSVEPKAALEFHRLSPSLIHFLDAQTSFS
jgi:hypothetical protein